MPANWSSFKSNVANYIIAADPGKDRADFGEHIAREYHSAIGPSQSIWGQTHVSKSNSNLISTYRTEFDRMQEELDEDGYALVEPPLVNDVDEDGNEIPFTGRSSDQNNKNPAAPDPEYADPDMTEVSEPVIDPEELNIFIDEYGDEYDLYEYRYFEFGLDGNETRDELSNIISNRILFKVMIESSGSKREKLWTWINSFDVWQDAASTNATQKRKAFWAKLKDSMNDNGIDADYVIDKVKVRTREQLRLSYVVETWNDTKSQMKGGRPSEMKYNPGKKDFRNRIIQQPFDEDNDSDDYEESPVVTEEFICYFSGHRSWEESSKWNDTQVEREYREDELEDEWTDIETVSTAEDVVDKKNTAAPYMFTRQKTVDALAEIENDEAGDSPYDILAEETIDYWKSTTIQPLSSTPPALPCLSSSPLGGKYIPVYYGNKKKLAEGIRKALNAGKESDNIPEAANKVATALSLAYARHLMQLKFIYQGGIPVPLVPYVPMIGFVPNVF